MYLYIHKQKKNYMSLLWYFIFICIISVKVWFKYCLERTSVRTIILSQSIILSIFLCIQTEQSVYKRNAFIHTSDLVYSGHALLVAIIMNKYLRLRCSFVYRQHSTSTEPHIKVHIVHLLSSYIVYTIHIYKYWLS